MVISRQDRWDGSRCKRTIIFLAEESGTLSTTDFADDGLVGGGHGVAGQSTGPLRTPAWPRRGVRGAAACLELPTTKALLFTLQWLVVGLVGLACHVILVREISPACFAILMVALLFLHRQNPLAGFMVYLQILLYQNVVVSVFSSRMTAADYTLLSGTSFIGGLVLVSGPAWRMLRSRRPFRAGHPGVVKTTRYIAIAVGVALAYTAYGAVVAAPTSAVVGFRNATAILFAVVIGLDIGDTWGYRTVATCFLASASFGVLLALLEIADPVWYLTLVHAADFGNLKNSLSVKAHMFSADNLIDTMLSLPFNTDLLSALMPGLTYRFGGPNMHSISYGYVLAVTELILLSVGQVGLVVPLLLLSFLIGVKGSAILFGATVLLYYVWRTTSSVRLLLSCGMVLSAVYVGYGIWSGQRSGDYHVIGFIGGVNGFLENPLGHGVGAGGNLSLGTLTATKWQEYQHSGAANVGLESAVGVLIYQMGVGSAAIFAAFVTLLRAGPFGIKWRRPKATDLLFIGFGIGLVNGVFQEEAYSPYAVGLLALFCGVLVANGQRPSRLLDVTGS